MNALTAPVLPAPVLPASLRPDEAQLAATAAAQAAAAAKPAAAAPTFIRAVEVWVPDAEGLLLVLGSAWYGRARRFGMHSEKMCFGRGEGLPGQAWDSGHPALIKRFEGSAFRRTAAAHAEGLTSAVALPVFKGSTLKAVVLVFCGDNPDTRAEQAGAIELWRNQPAESKDMVLDDGYYGALSNVFEFISRRTAFRKGHGLPGQVWDSGLPLFMADLGKGGRFLRADSAQKVGINRGFALPCATADDEHWVVAFLSALGTPLVRRYETWLPDPEARELRRHDGFCEHAGLLESGPAQPAVVAGQGTLGQVLATGVPAISLQLAQEPGVVGASASTAGLTVVVGLPVVQAGRVVAVVAWYF